MTIIKKMNLFRKRNKPTENISLTAIAGAIISVASLLIAFVPEIGIGLVFLLPLLSAAIGYLCLPKYLLAYALATTALALGVASFNIAEPLLIVVPSILTGTLMGFLLSKKQASGLIVFLTGLLQLGLDYAAVGLLEMSIAINPIDTFLRLFALEGKEKAINLVPSLMLCIALSQTSLTFFLFGLLSMGQQERKGWINHPFERFLYPSLGIAMGALSLGIGVISRLWGSLFLVCSLYFSLMSIACFHNEKRAWIYIALVAMLIVAFYLRAAIAPLYGEGLLLYSFFGIALDFLALLSNLLKGKDRDEVS